MLKSFSLLLLSSILSSASSQAATNYNEDNYNVNTPDMAKRTSLSVRVQKEYLKYFDGKLVKILGLYSIYLDEDSTYQIHEENNFIDLSCFNCILRIDSKEGIKQAGANSYGGSAG